MKIYYFLGEPKPDFSNNVFVDEDSPFDFHKGDFVAINKLGGNHEVKKVIKFSGANPAQLVIL